MVGASISLTRFLAGALPLSPSLLSQIRALLLHDNANKAEEVDRWIQEAGRP